MGGGREEGKREQGKGQKAKGDEPCRALSSENSLATSSNFRPERSAVRASSLRECFSHFWPGQRAS